MYPDAVVLVTAADTVQIVPRTTAPALLDHVALHGVQMAADRSHGMLRTAPRQATEKARALIAALRIAGFGVAAEPELTPSPRQSEQARRAAMVRALAVARQALADWDAVSDSLCDAHGRPLDETAYGLRRAELDHTAWQQFESVFLVHGGMLLDQARRAAAGMTGKDARTAHHHIDALAAALTEGFTVRAEGDRDLAALCDADGKPRDRAAYADAVAERDAEGWHAAHTWITHGDLLVYLAPRGTHPTVPTPTNKRTPAAPTAGSPAPRRP